MKWVDIYVGVSPYLALVLLQALFTIPLGLYFRFYYQRTRSLAWLPLLFIASEGARELIPFGGFGWTQIGYSMISAPIVQLASIGGVLLLSGLILAALSTQRRAQAFFVSSLILLSFFLHNPIGQGSLDVAAVQGTSPQRTNSFYNDIRKTFDNHLQLSINAKRVDVIAWPEDVIDGSVSDREFSSKLALLKGQNLIVGDVPYDGQFALNRSTMIDTEGHARSIYLKQALVPFGEYVPLRTVVEKLNGHVEEVTDFRPGNQTIVHHVNGVTIAPLICFEFIDPAVVASAAREGEVFLAQTNTATFVGTAEAQQQFSALRMKAIEYSRPILSVSTMGVTGFIDHNGRVVSTLPEGEKGVLYGQLVPNDHKTIYAAFPYIAYLFAFFFGALGKR